LRRPQGQAAVLGTDCRGHRRGSALWSPSDTDYWGSRCPVGDRSGADPRALRLDALAEAHTGGARGWGQPWVRHRVRRRSGRIRSRRVLHRRPWPVCGEDRNHDVTQAPNEQHPKRATKRSAARYRTGRIPAGADSASWVPGAAP